MHYGRYGNTALNWYNASDPRPDYRKLPFAIDINVHPKLPKLRIIVETQR